MEVDLLTNDFHFKSLYEDPRWLSIINIVKENKRKDEELHLQKL